MTNSILSPMEILPVVGNAVLSAGDRESISGFKVISSVEDRYVNLSCAA